MCHTPANTTRVRFLRAMSGHWLGDVVDLDPSSAEWLIDRGEVEPAPDLDLTAGGRAFRRPELAEPPPTPPRARTRRGA